MTAAAGFWRKLRLTLEMIRFEHSVFALPFALTGALLAIREDGFATEGLGSKACVDRRRHGRGAIGRHGIQPGRGLRTSTAGMLERRRVISLRAC